MISSFSPRLSVSVAALTLSITASIASAEAIIDSDLSGQVDFRDTAYGVCLDQASCTVGGITIKAERRDTEGLAWVDGRIYWDPIDGLGVRDGAQNDEIDFNERLLVSFEEPKTVTKVWFSDLFHTEDRRYGSGNTDRVEGIAEDAESAGMNLILEEATQQTVVVEADDRLPWASFNQEISVRFREGGDLRRRVVIDNESVTIVAPGEDGRGRVTEQRFAIGEIDPEKKAIFDGVETVEIDLTDILAEFNGTQLFGQGTQNFELIRAMTEDPESLVRMKDIASRKRESVRMSNGEVAWTFETPIQSDAVQFFAPFDASNEFSVSGLVME